MNIRNTTGLLALTIIIASCTELKKSLSVSVFGSGSGIVTSNPTGINCISNPCSSEFSDRINVRLTATPNDNSTFEGWNGACTGTGPCSVDMTTNLSVQARFTLKPGTTESKFTLEPQQAVFFVAQKAVAFWKVAITNRQNFNTGGIAFDSVTLENNAILGTGASKIQFAYRKTDSSQDEIVLEIGAGSSVPVGDYPMKVKATAGAITQEVAVTVRVAPCSLGCQ
jgi:hypothetical protein